MTLSLRPSTPPLPPKKQIQKKFKFFWKISPDLNKLIIEDKFSAQTPRQTNIINKQIENENENDF